MGKGLGPCGQGNGPGNGTGTGRGGGRRRRTVRTPGSCGETPRKDGSGGGTGNRGTDRQPKK
jgi:hypothetical protein